MGHRKPTQVNGMQHEPDKADFATRLGERIAAARKRAHYSQAKLADRLGMTGNNLGNYEKGRVQPPAEVLAGIATFTDTSADVLLGITSAEFLAADDTERRLLVRWRAMDAETKLRMMIDFAFL
jgi:transcriptional regulator with XRE-family HTH domain